MGKKNKKRDIWDLTPEEQKQQAEDLYAIENGQTDLLSLARIDVGINDNGFSHGLETEIVRSLLGSSKPEDDEVVSLYDDEHIVGKTNMEELLGESEDNKKEKKVTLNNDLRKVRFDVIESLHRVIVNDGIAPTAYSLDIGINQDIVGSYDEVTVEELTSYMYEYIISLKHPTAIYEYYDFINRDYWKFMSVDNDNYNHNRYMFFRAGGYVLCYLIDEDSFSKFYENLSKSNYTTEDILKTFISLSYAVGTLNQAFFIEDDWYIKVFMNSEFNKQKEFHNMFVNDLSTKLISSNDEISENDGVDFTDLHGLQSYVRNSITKITGTSYDDDDDEEYYDDEDDEDELEVSIPENYPDEKADVTVEVDDNEDVSIDLITDEMTDVDITVTEKEIDKIEPSDDEDLVVSVIRKK